MTLDKYGSYYINGYAMLFAIETGVRVGELCALKWEDIEEESIHIHSQQLANKEKGGKDYYFVPYTKNEKGESEDGRDFPLTRKIKALLDEIKEKQEKMGIESEFIFCHEDGDWIKTDAYLTFLRRLCQSLGLKVTNNHALRMSLNSNVLIPMGISPADRAAMLGHSIETNLRFYSFAHKDYISNVRAKLDGDDPEDFSRFESNFSESTQANPSKIIIFTQKKSSKTLISQRS
jgi:integrase